MNVVAFLLLVVKNTSFFTAVAHILGSESVIIMTKEDTTDIMPERLFSFLVLGDLYTHCSIFSCILRLSKMPAHLFGKVVVMDNIIMKLIQHTVISLQ